MNLVEEEKENNKGKIKSKLLQKKNQRKVLWHNSFKKSDRERKNTRA